MPYHRTTCEACGRDRGACLCEARAQEIRALRQRAEAAEAERDRLKALIPLECCQGANPNCYGPRGCLVRAQEADTTPGDELLKRAERAEAERDRLRDECYTDLLRQMDEAWGKDSGRNQQIGRIEIEAFLASRMTHRPTERHRTRYAALRDEVIAFSSSLLEHGDWNREAVRERAARLRAERDGEGAT